MIEDPIPHNVFLSTGRNLNHKKGHLQFFNVADLRLVHHEIAHASIVSSRSTWSAQICCFTTLECDVVECLGFFCWVCCYKQPRDVHTMLHEWNLLKIHGHAHAYRWLHFRLASWRPASWLPFENFKSYVGKTCFCFCWKDFLVKLVNFVGVLRLVLLASLEHSIAGLLAAIGRMITKCPFAPGCAGRWEGTCWQSEAIKRWGRACLKAILSAHVNWCHGVLFGAFRISRSWIHE